MQHEETLQRIYTHRSTHSKTTTTFKLSENMIILCFITGGQFKSDFFFLTRPQVQNK